MDDASLLGSRRNVTALRKLTENSLSSLYLCLERQTELKETFRILFLLKSSLLFRSAKVIPRQHEGPSGTETLRVLLLIMYLFIRRERRRKRIILRAFLSLRQLLGFEMPLKVA